MIAGVCLLVVMARGERKETKGESLETNVINKIATVCAAISKGDFEARIIDIQEPGSLADAQHKVNDMIDRCDAFVREATASLKAVCRNIYYRRIFYGGLQGSFRVAAEIINNSVKTQEKAVEKARLDAAAEQASLIDSLAGGLKNLAEGDLTFRLGDFPDAYRQICDDFNSAMTGLQETIKAIMTATREVSSATAEIATSTTDLSQRTEEQAACLEETSASMEQIAATVKQNAENAQHANQSASNMRDAADRGGQVVGKAIDAMARIETSSRKISDIIGVIDEIARQTNLLALNAAVEAARAGESGRGFAVVASEVRSLAQRSAQAAKDIKDLISNSNGQVKEGVDLVNDAGAALHEVVEFDQGGGRNRVRHRQRQHRAIDRHRADQQSAQPDGRGDAAELGLGRGERGDRQDAGTAGRGDGRAHRDLQDRHRCGEGPVREAGSRLKPPLLNALRCGLAVVCRASAYGPSCRTRRRSRR